MPALLASLLPVSILLFELIVQEYSVIIDDDAVIVSALIYVGWAAGLRAMSTTALGAKRLLAPDGEGSLPPIVAPGHAFERAPDTKSLRERAEAGRLFSRRAPAHDKPPGFAIADDFGPAASSPPACGREVDIAIDCREMQMRPATPIPGRARRR